MVQSQVDLGLRSETLFLAVSLLDSFLAFQQVRPRLRLAAVCCLFVAAKFEEIEPMDVRHFERMTWEAPGVSKWRLAGQECSKQEILAMEASLLTYLEFSLCRATAVHFLDRRAWRTPRKLL